MNKINLFQLAIKNNELLDFSLGKGIYLIPDREYGDHFVLGSWYDHIMPFIINSNSDIESILTKMFSELIDEPNISIDVKYQMIMYHMHVFYYYKKEEKIKTADIFSSLNLKIHDIIEKTQQFYLDSKNQSKLENLDTVIKEIQNNGGLLNYKLKNL